MSVYVRRKLLLAAAEIYAVAKGCDATPEEVHDAEKALCDAARAYAAADAKDAAYCAAPPPAADKPKGKPGRPKKSRVSKVPRGLEPEGLDDTSAVSRTGEMFNGSQPAADAAADLPG